MQDVRTLVTGGGGFLGRYVVEQLLDSGAKVVSFSRRHHPALAELGVEQIQGDLRDRGAVVDACRGVESVHHVAAVAGIWGPRKHYYEINAQGTLNVISGCIQHNVARLIYTSSPSVTFSSRDQEGVDESEPYSDRWLCYYPETKALAERAVLEADRQSDVRTCALRPHLIWGPRDEHLIPRLLRRARTGSLRRVGDGRNLIDMVYVENAAQAQLLADRCLAENGAARGKTYFISQGEPVNCWDWINQILALEGIPPLAKHVSFRTAWYAGSILECVYKVLRKRSEPKMTRFLAAQLAKSHYFSLEAARRDLGYEPRISIDQGMQRLAEWLHSQPAA